MLTSLLTQLIQIISTQTIFILFLAQLAKLTAYSKKPHVTSIDSLDYQKLVVDYLLIVVELEKLDYRLLLQQHLDRTGKAIKPVQRRKNSLSVLKIPSAQSVKHLTTIFTITTVGKDNSSAKSVRPTSIIK